MLSVAQQKKLETCNPKLIALIHTAEFSLYTDMPYGIVELGVAFGHRTEEEQEHCVTIGTSTLHWPDSKHNKIPSEAVDVFPLINGIAVWDNDEYWRILLERIRDAAKNMRLKVRFGADWRKPDIPHIELI